MIRFSLFSKTLASHSVLPAATLLACLLGTAAARAGLAQREVNPQGEIVQAFLKRAGEYVALQKKLEKGLPRLSPTDDTTKIEAHQHALAARIREERAGAQPGDIFGDAAPILRTAVDNDLAKRSPTERRATMEEVPARKPAAINADYPERAPLATVPPLLLEQLPRLPEGLEYRFMEKDLILRDTRANTIADVLPAALPPKKR